MTGSIRLFVPDALHAAAEVAPSPAQAHYLGAVMRRAPGDTLRLFNGRDGEWAARIAHLKRDRAMLAVVSLLRPQAAGADIWLAFAPLKRDTTDLLVQKATELGAAALLPVFTERTNAARVNTERLLAIATEAAEQCERLTVPAIAEPVRLPALLAGWPAGRTLYAAIERADAPAIRPTHGPCALLVGPGGGFAGGELELMRRNPFLQPVNLGPLILRAETAAIVGLALLQATVGG
ncbi:MAG: 16S rRNA (uracil(1498)-N(3))-methyltransferase [Rhodospirillales bacterium 70-18]|nr:16S rRNA (uracil(1498)-N(3))-methyltransferase [Rhodospirillales bacterium]OJY68250.1 MAG: 16S rRNA (uracil(1498)-N(3))-methyltransferase [Rhodospirillales bacterium 70-18]